MVAPWTTLLDALRDQLDLTGTKKAAITASAAPARCWSTGGDQLLPDARGDEGRRRDHHHRRPCARRSAASAAAGLHRARRVSVRLLHAGTDLLGGGPDRRGQGQDRRRNSRTDERQHLPLRRLSEHRGGDPAGDARWATSHEQFPVRARQRRRRRGAPDRRRSGREIHRRRHQPDRPDERRCRAPGPADRHLAICRSRASRKRPTAACASARWCRIPISPITR